MNSKDFINEERAARDGQTPEERQAASKSAEPKHRALERANESKESRAISKAAEDSRTPKPAAPGFKVRAGQKEFERGVDLHRVTGLLARRQYGKTTIASRISLKKMMRLAGHTVVFGSVKLDLGREIVRKEAEAMQRAFQMMAETAKAGKTLLSLADSQTGKELLGDAAAGLRHSRAPLKADDFAELYEASRLEFRLWHSNTVYSRTKVVALNPAAVGETGDLILDEVARVKNFRDVVEAVMPIIASNPEFRCIYTTTPPPDDMHYSFELLAPPIGAELAVNPKGNWYKSELGVWVLRITAYDAAADGVPLYDDDTGAAMSPEESRKKAHDRDAWDRNYGCKFVLGGTAACGLLQLDSAQRRGQASLQAQGFTSNIPGAGCRLFQINSDADFDEAVKWLTLVGRDVGPRKIGLGWDLATTTKETSNPNGFSVLEQQGNEYVLRAVFVWKTDQEDLALERARSIATATEARRLCIDATNERFFSQRVRKELAALVPVELVIGSETIEVPGEPEPLTMKQFLGGQLVAELDDNHLWLPPERFLREDWRLVRKEKGQFVCEPDANGRHGDTFDGTKLALHALRSTAGGIESVAGIRVGGNRLGRGRVPVFIPRRLV